MDSTIPGQNTLTYTFTSSTRLLLTMQSPSLFPQPSYGGGHPHEVPEPRENGRAFKLPQTPPALKGEFWMFKAMLMHGQGAPLLLHLITLTQHLNKSRVLKFQHFSILLFILVVITQSLNTPASWQYSIPNPAWHKPHQTST